MINERLVSVEERQSILDRIQTALVFENYPTSANDPLKKYLKSLKTDETKKEISKQLNN